MSLVVLIPTYNERENLGELLKKIFSLKLEGVSAVIVDDNSPDGTADLAESLGKKYPVSVIRRSRKAGLGTAYADAFKAVLMGKPDFIIQMDADFSHDPAVIPRFLERIQNYDVVIGSRYISGGDVVNWDYGRQLVSKFGNIYARAILSLPYMDLTGGFKCWRREALEKIDFNNLSSTGYNFQIETTYFAHKSGFKICEIPIIFTERKFGTSKFNISIMFESFWKVLALRIKR